MSEQWEGFDKITQEQDLISPSEEQLEILD